MTNKNDSQLEKDIKEFVINQKEKSVAGVNKIYCGGVYSAEDKEYSLINDIFYNMPMPLRMNLLRKFEAKKEGINSYVIKKQVEKKYKLSFNFIKKCL